jgi:hypothetical protein
MSQRIQHLKTEWEDRGHRLGLTQRAVLFKRFPRWLNDFIHRQHVRFVLQHIPAGVPSSISCLTCDAGIAKSKEPFFV